MIRANLTLSNASLSNPIVDIDAAISVRSGGLVVTGGTSVTADMVGGSEIITLVSTVDAPGDGDYRSQQSGAWQTAGTWEVYDAVADTWATASVKPGSTDVATVLASHTVSLGGTESIGTLIIEDSATTPGIVSIGGLPLHIVDHLDMQHALANSGQIKWGSGGSLVADSPIAIAGDVFVVTSQAPTISSSAAGDVITVTPTGYINAIAGNLTISADMIMNGTVEADEGRTITISSHGPRAGSGGDWIIHSNATLKFNTTSAVDILASGGRIDLLGGTLDIDQDVDFAGGIKITKGGTIDVASGKTLNVTGRYIE